MKAFTAAANLIYLFWPLILLLGLRKLFQKQFPLKERLRLAIQRVFIGWLFMAAALAIIYWQDQQPILLLPAEINYFVFGAVGLVVGSITIVSSIHHRRKDRIRLSNTRTLDDLMALSPTEFEKLVATLYKAYGHKAQVLGGTADHGVDIIVLSDNDEKWVVQCKRYEGSVGEPVVRDLFGTMGHEGAQRAYLITTGSFTAQAKDWARGKPIVLYDGDDLVKLIRRTQLHRSKLGR
jgi:hypothetical protein